MSKDGQADNWTIKKVLLWATEHFQSLDFDSPRLDAELLLGHALGLSRIKLIIESKRPLAASELTTYRRLIQRRHTGEPIAYLLGEREFHGLVFQVDKRVLVPRPDTEILVETALRRTESKSEFGHLLDLCTGSGCVAIAFAKARPNWKVIGTDLSEDALAVARSNAERLGVTWSVNFQASDLFAQVQKTPAATAIISNPPYIPKGEIPKLMADVRDFEPHSALDGGADGLDLVRVIIAEAQTYLEAAGLLALEIGHDQAARVHTLMERAGFTDVERVKDYAGIERVVSGRRAV